MWTLKLPVRRPIYATGCWMENRDLPALTAPPVNMELCASCSLAARAA